MYIEKYSRGQYSLNMNGMVLHWQKNRRLYPAIYRIEMITSQKRHFTLTDAVFPFLLVTFNNDPS